MKIWRVSRDERWQGQMVCIAKNRKQVLELERCGEGATYYAWKETGTRISDADWREYKPTIKIEPVLDRHGKQIIVESVDEPTVLLDVAPG